MRISLKDGHAVTITISSQNNQPKVEVVYSPGLSGKMYARSVTLPSEPTIVVEVKEEEVRS